MRKIPKNVHVKVQKGPPAELNNTWFAVAPELKVFGAGRTRKKAIRSLTDAIDLFFKEVQS